MKKMAVIVALGLAGHAPGAELYSQPTTSDPASVGLGWFSHSAPRPTRNFKHADNFTLATTSRVERVAWWGLSENLAHPNLSNFTAFTVEFFDASINAGGGAKPGDLIASETFDLAGTAAAATGRTASSGAVEFRHEVALGAPVELLAGEIYFIAISAAFIDPAGDAWQWQDADLTDGLSASYDYSRARWLAQLDTDSAFVLEGTPVPAPAGLAALGLGLTRRRPRR